jgi:dihydrofolate synthase/folylpolyglutamate synthase
MGGRLDATNVLSPLVSVITNIDLEHTEFLGDTLELIAGEKAGIIKRNTPVVTGAVQPGVLQVIEREAARKAAPVFLLGREFSANHIRPGGEQQFAYRGMQMSLEGLRIGLLGRYQVDNACLALAAAECLHAAGVTIAEDAVRKGLAQSRWEGRLECVARRPDIYLDGAHNPASARMLARAVAELRPAYGRLLLVVGILGDKDVSGILAELIPLADHVIVTRPDYARALDPDALAAKVRSLHPAVDTAGSVRQAIERAKSEAKADDLILITGSLYVVGDARGVLFDDGLPRALPGLKG